MTSLLDDIKIKYIIVAHTSPLVTIKRQVNANIKLRKRRRFFLWTINARKDEGHAQSI